MRLENTVHPWLHCVTKKLHITMAICHIFNVQSMGKMHLIYEKRPY